MEIASSIVKLTCSQFNTFNDDASPSARCFSRTLFARSSNAFTSRVGIFTLFFIYALVKLLLALLAEQTYRGLLPYFDKMNFGAKNSLKRPNDFCFEAPK